VSGHHSQDYKTKIETTMKLSEVKEILIQLSGIPSHKALGFTGDLAIKRLAQVAEKLIEYHIGDELEAVKSQVEAEIETIKAPFLQQYEALNDEEKKAQEKPTNRAISAAITGSKTLKDLEAQEAALWAKEVDNELKPVAIEPKEYGELFKEPKSVTLYGATYTVDGYEALLSLITKDIIILSE
jgi:hypothetical protein